MLFMIRNSSRLSIENLQFAERLNSKIENKNDMLQRNIHLKEPISW